MNKFAIGELARAYRVDTGKFLFECTIVATPEPHEHYFKGKLVYAGNYAVQSAEGYSQGPERCLRKIDGDAKKVVSWDTCVFRPKSHRVVKWVPPKLEGVKA